MVKQEGNKMDIIINIEERNLIIKIKGDIDHHTAEEIREKAEKEYKRLNAKNMIFNFEDVAFMDSSGIGMIIGRYKNIEKQGGNVAVCNVSENVKRIFNMSGLHKIISCYDTEEEAINKL